MRISASSIYQKHVLLQNGKKLGKVENLIINRVTGDVDLLVFPEIMPKLIRDHAGKVVGMMAAQATGRIKDFIPIDLIAPLAGSMSGPIGGIVATDVRKRVRVSEESYYLIPTSLIKNVTSESVQVDMTEEECRDWCSTVIAPPEVYAAFYDSSVYKGEKRSVSITIGLSSIKDTVVTGPGGNEFVVKNIDIDTDSGKGVFVDH